MWPGLVGKGPDSEPPIDLDTMIELTAKAEVDGVKFDGIDIFHAAPHTNIDFTDDEVKHLADKAASTRSRHRLHRGAGLAAGGRRFGHGLGRRPQEVRRQCPQVLSDSARNCASWACATTASSASIRRPARPTGPRIPPATPGHRRDLARSLRRGGGLWRAAGRRGRNLLGRHAQLEGDGRDARSSRPPQIIGFQADMAHTLLYTMGYNAPEAAFCPQGRLEGPGRARRRSTR